jgi:hypothetical protein
MVSSAVVARVSFVAVLASACGAEDNTSAATDSDGAAPHPKDGAADPSEAGAKPSDAAAAEREASSGSPRPDAQPERDAGDDVSTGLGDGSLDADQEVGGGDAASGAEVVVDQAAATWLSVDSTILYWVGSTTGPSPTTGVFASPKNGGGARLLYTYSGLGGGVPGLGFYGLCASGATLYTLEVRSSNPWSIRLRSVPKDGSPGAELASMQPVVNALESAGIATDGTNVFWSFNGQLLRTPCAGGATSMLGNATVSAFDPATGTIFSARSASVLLSGTGGIDRVNGVTGAVSPWLAATQPTVTLAGQALVFTDLTPTDGGTAHYPLEVWQAPLSATAAAEVGPQPSMRNDLQGFASDGSFVYWFAGGVGGPSFDGALRRAPIATNVAIALAQGFDSVEAPGNVLALDERRVYFSAYLTPSSSPAAASSPPHAAILAVPK